MADYKELIRKAIQALPENNGAARRAVYEKARSALVGQLRALDPPLSPREITQHRLQLEDCIRQVEQEASEAVIAGLKQNEEFAGSPSRGTNGAARPAAASAAAHRPVPARPTTVPSGIARPAATHKPTGGTPAVAPRVAAQGQATAAAVATAAAPRAVAHGQVAVLPEADLQARKQAETIEDIIAAASGEGGIASAAAAKAEPVELDGDDDAPLARIEPHPAPNARNGANGHGAALVTPLPTARGETRPVPALVARAEAAKAALADEAAETQAHGLNGLGHAADNLPARPHVPGRAALIDPTFGHGNKAGLADSTALSTVREVDLEAPPEGDPQVAIERAIATLEREARNDGEEANGFDAESPVSRFNGKDRRRDSGFRDLAESEGVFARAPVEAERGGNALMIFLLVFLALLVIAGGAGFWAWHEGFIDFDAMFGKQGATVSDNSAPATTPASPAAPAVAPSPAPGNVPAPTAPPAAASTGNGSNTEPAANAPSQSAAQMSSAAPAVPAPSAPTPPAAAPAAAAPAAVPAPPTEPSAQSGPKGEERLPQSAEATPAPATPDANAAAASGSQSLLLEASQDGTTGAVPFSGTVEWSKGTDETGQPTLIGKANIPARNLGVSVLIRKNSDPTLPASHLMEINFTVTDSFIGGSISGLPGVLLKNEELVQGTPLVGASARVVGNSFLFALSSSQADEATNKDLLTSRKWMDLAIIYATGKKAIITLEKDDKAEALFNEVFAAWSKGSPAAPTPAAATTPAPAPTAKAGG
ncbi:MAG TPA: hypothetical protein VHB74_13745 [Devosia sp.]|nr:hypothetical protein [Devosia sp.]